jgi:hypothetical protein
MTREATDRPCPCPNDFAVGGFDILRPSLNVAFKLCRRLGEGGLHDDACGNRDSEAKEDSPKPNHRSFPMMGHWSP